MATRPAPRVSPGSTVRCYRDSPEGRVGVVRGSRYRSATEYDVEWIDGRTPEGTRTWVRAVNIIRVERTSR